MSIRPHEAPLDAGPGTPPHEEPLDDMPRTWPHAEPLGHAPHILPHEVLSTTLSTLPHKGPP
jgi:hypothetical protein